MIDSSRHPFDIDAYLARPLLARIASNGPTVRPVWYLWEDGCFWWLTGDWSSLRSRLADDPRVALVVDTCDIAAREVRQVIAYGDAECHPYDPDRAFRKIARYLGPDPHEWGPRWNPADSSGGVEFIRLAPDRLIARDLSRSLPDWTEPHPANR